MAERGRKTTDLDGHLNSGATVGYANEGMVEAELVSSPFS